MAVCERLTGRIRAGLGWEPPTTLPEGLEAQIVWQAQGAQPLAAV